MKKSILNGLAILIVVILLWNIGTSTYAISEKENEQQEQLEMIRYDMETREETIVRTPPVEEILEEINSKAKSRESGNLRQITIDENGGSIEPYIANPEDLIMPTDIIGKDDREKVKDTTIYPYKTICLLVTTYPNESLGYSTGTLIGNKTLLTAAHCVYNSEKGGYATNIAVYPSTYGTTDPYGSTAVKQFTVSSAFRDGDKLDDWAIAELYDSIGCEVGGYMGVKFADDFSFLVNEKVTITGYPSDKTIDIPLTKIRYYMYEAEGKVTDEIDGNFRCETDGTEGESGAPVYYNPEFCIGVFMGGYDEATNICCAITRSRFITILSWLNDTKDWQSVCKPDTTLP